MKTEIVKLQMPLATNATEPMALVYNKSRKFETFLKITEDLAELMGDEPKAYFKANIDGKGIELMEEVPNPGW